MRVRNQHTDMKILIISVVGLLCVFFLVAPSKASTNNDWVAPGPMEVNQKEEIPRLGNPSVQHCDGEQIEIRVSSDEPDDAGVHTVPYFACLTSNEHITLAYTSIGTYVSFHKSDRYFYRINGLWPIRQIVLSPHSDRAALEYNNNGTEYRINVYDNFSRRLTLDQSSLTYSITDWSNRLFPVSGAKDIKGSAPALSNNGKYMVYNTATGNPGSRNLVGRIIRVDLDKGESKYFAYEWFGRFPYRHPAPHFAVTNDGQYAIGGGSAHLYLWHITGDCIEDYVEGDDTAGSQQCDRRSILPDDYGEIPLLYDQERTYGLRFNDDATELQFIINRSGVYKKISVSPSGYVPPRSGLEYLALGDSYSSGEGDIERDARDKKYYRHNTDINGSSNSPREKCHISTRSYPYYLARGMNLALDSPKEWDMIACSGALIRDSLWDDPNYMGQGSRLHGFSDMKQMQAIALNEFIPGRIKQIEFVKKYKPKVITLTMGGNDIGFGEKISACATPQFLASQTCEDATLGKRSTLAGQITSQYSNLKSLYKELYEASGRQAKIYVLGYPQFISDAEMRSCSSIASLNYEERKMIYNSVTYLNSVIETAAKAAGVYYVDIENSLSGHRLCDDGEKYVTGVVGIPIRVANDPQESFHPNSKGHAAIAQSVRNQVRQKSLIEYDICHDGALICPDITTTKDTIKAPEYFKDIEPKNSQYKQMTNETAIKGNLIQVITESYMLRPFSAVNVTLHSDPVHLGDYTVGRDGSLDVEAVVPGAIPAGYHTLVVTGETFSGEPIEYEQIVLVQGTDPNDIDENGTPDSQQPCGAFIAASGIDQDQDGIDDACDPDIGSAPDPNPQPTDPIPEAPVAKPTVISVIKNIVKIAIKFIRTLFGW